MTRRVRIGEPTDEGVVGIALSAAAGFASGLALGIIAGEMLGNLHADRVKGAVRRLRRKPEGTVAPQRVLDDVQRALQEHEATCDLEIMVHCPGQGLVELTGIAPDAVARQIAGDLARAVPGADVVVNRILVNGSDLPPQPLATTPSRS